MDHRVYYLRAVDEDFTRMMPRTNLTLGQPGGLTLETLPLDYVPVAEWETSVKRPILEQLALTHHLMQEHNMPKDHRKNINLYIGEGRLDHVSMAVGDLIENDDIFWFCLPTGWDRLTF